MASEIKDLFGSSTAFTITLASLASSTAGAGRQTTIVDNTSTRFSELLVWAKIKQGTSPTANRSVYVYLIRSDGSGNRTDNAGASDAALTIKNAKIIGILNNGSAPSSGDVLYEWFYIHKPGREFGLCVVHDTVAALDATNSNSELRYYGINPESQ